MASNAGRAGKGGPTGIEMTSPEAWSGQQLEQAGTDYLRLNAQQDTCRGRVWRFMDGVTPAGKVYEFFNVGLILFNTVCFIFGSLFDIRYNIDTDGRYLGPSCDWCDLVLFGNNPNNELHGSSLLEIGTVIVFSVDYLFRFYSCIEDPDWPTRSRYVFSFFSVVDLVAILPFYIEQLSRVEIGATQFLRLLRLLRLFRFEGRYSVAFTLLQDVFKQKSTVLITAGFVGGVVWIICSGFYYLAEHKNPLMIYCPTCPDVDMDACTISPVGFVDCAKGGCPGGSSTCFGLFESIPRAMFQTIVNLFGEFPLATQYRGWGMVVGTIVALFAVAVFGIPCGIIGSGFEELLAKQKEDEKDAREAAGLPRERRPSEIRREQILKGVVAEKDAICQACIKSPWRAATYEFLHSYTDAGDRFQTLLIVCILISIISFFLGSVAFIQKTQWVMDILNVLEAVTIFVFTVDYVLRMYCIGILPEYSGCLGLLKYALSFGAVVDFLSVAPSLYSMVNGKAGSTGVWLRVLRLARIGKTEAFAEATSVLGCVMSEQGDVLAVTGFMALINWIVFSGMMYFSERLNPDQSMAQYYNNIPNSMWITLLNLSGEVPLNAYTPMGQVTIGVMGVVAVGFVSIPIGVISAGLKDHFDCVEEDEDVDVILEKATTPDPAFGHYPRGSAAQVLMDCKGSIRMFVEGETVLGRHFGNFIILLIMATVGLVIMETVPGWRCNGEEKNLEMCIVFEHIEAVSIVLFTIEYLLRLVSAVAPLQFMVSFYALVDLLAIVPYYVAQANRGGWVDRHTQLFLMFRILRLLKVSKQVPALTLIDDAFKARANALAVTFSLAAIIWIICSSMMYLAESTDVENGIDPQPLTGCNDGCTEAQRYDNAFASLPFTFVHLTGDYPIVDYNKFGRCVCTFMVFAAAGIVGIPTGLVADSFSQLVAKHHGEDTMLRSYDVEFLKLHGQPVPREFRLTCLDTLQWKVHVFLHGDEHGHRSFKSFVWNCSLLTLIFMNVAVVLIQSIPQVEADVPVVIFDVFETVSVAVFTVEYLMRLFSVPKDIVHLYSRWLYVTTFFGIVDLVTVVPWYLEIVLRSFGYSTASLSRIFRLVRLFRLLQLEHFLTAFTVLDNVFFRSASVLGATGLLALVIWVATAALFFLFERENPNFCSVWETQACSDWYTEGCVCAESAMDTLPHALFYTAIFLCGEWALIDFTVPGKFLCLFLCVIGIGLYAIPTGTLFESFGAVLEGGLDALDQDKSPEDVKDDKKKLDTRAE
eukprot:TRINITY_DN964_c0_g4_i1.p1 TRINITY_DN964_c0_g4~~TRINITY_DN964_c0_g4_i1.p1  ORF type:complete len:1265 (+),score=230.66 TRINITY_DN964_c0_g4_i1:161-3955(+)